MSRLKFVLLRARAVCFIAEFAKVMLVVAALLPLIMLPMLLLDWGLVLAEQTRAVLRMVLPVFVGCGLLYALVAACRVACRLPRELDALNRDSRATIASALGLHASSAGSLGAWLALESQKDAVEAVEIANRRHPALRRWGKGFLCALLAVFCVMGVQQAMPQAFTTLGLRLLTPHADIPPYSPLVFELTPQSPEVHYGEDLPVSCKISGAELQSEVVLLLRAEGVPEQALPVFFDKDGQYSRVLEKVTAPCSIAFATADGRARSAFVPVKVNYSPRILSGTAVITPLPYTGEAPQKVTLGGSEIRVPDGGSVTFSLHCSLPLARGEALFTPSGAKEPVKLEGVASGKDFELTMEVRQPGTLMLQVYDADGRPADTPVRTRLAVLPDTPPQVAITVPENGAYVVEGFPLKVQVEASDDFGVSRMMLFKALAPYRQHGVAEDMQKLPRSVRVNRTFDTMALGFRAGDTIELRAEVGDDNPFRFNIVSTPTTKVQVISGAEYAEIMRMQISYKAFMARYEALQQAIADADRALEAVENAETPEQREAARAAAMAALVRAQELAQTIAADFPAFDMDGKLSELAGQIAEEMAQQQQALSALNTAATQQEWQQAVQQIRNALQPQSDALAQQTQEARQVEALARLNALLHRFKQLAEQQKAHAELLARFRAEYGAPVTSQPSRLEGLGSRQAEIQDAYNAWLQDVKELNEQAASVPALAKLADKLAAISAACEREHVASLMAESVAAAAAHLSAESESHAAKASAAMQKLLNSELSEQSCDDAASQCRNALSAAAANTLAQMCKNNSCKNPGSGDGNTPGGRGGMGQGSGYGYSQAPAFQGNRLIGPGRADMTGQSVRGQGRAPHAGGSGNGNAEQPAADAAAPGVLTPGEQDYSGVNTEHVPPAYKDAVRSYFKR